MERRKHFLEGGPVAEFFFAGYAPFLENPNDLDVVGGGVAIDALKILNLLVVTRGE